VLNSRNTTVGFAERTRKNLLAIEAAREAGEDVHVVTQLINSLLGLVVFPWERGFREHTEHLELEALDAEGWPRWDVERGECHTLGRLLRLLRNGAAHSHIEFSSDSRRLDDVVIKIWNVPPKSAPDPDFVASIRADHLRDFCLKFTDLVLDRVG